MQDIPPQRLQKCKHTQRFKFHKFKVLKITCAKNGDIQIYDSEICKSENC